MVNYGKKVGATVPQTISVLCNLGRAANQDVCNFCGSMGDKEVLQIENKNRKICKKEKRQPKILKDLREYKVLKAKTKQATADFYLFERVFILPLFFYI